MTALLTKYFHFSASYSRGARVYGHNYRLGVTVDAMGREAEAELERRLRSELVEKLDSRDLGTDVGFLKGVEMSDEALLRVFWEIAAAQARPLKLHSLSLERDSRTRTTLAAAGGASA